MLLAIGLFLFPTVATTPITNTPKEHTLIVIDGNSLVATVPPVLIRPIVYGSLIDCLEHYESSHNPDAIGDHGVSFGILQFQKPTFQSFCVKKYRLKDDINDPEIQRICCDMMLEEDFKNVVNWSTYKLCVFK